MSIESDLLEASFKAHIGGSGVLTRRMVIKIANANGLTCKQCVKRLEGMGLCKQGTWKWFLENGGITKGQIEEVLKGEVSTNPMNTSNGYGFVIDNGKWWPCKISEDGSLVRSTGERVISPNGWLSSKEWHAKIGGQSAPWRMGWVPCPYCASECWCDEVDIGVGVQQAGPYHCHDCHASEIGPYDKERQLTDRERACGWYEPESEPGSSANVVGGRIVSHKEARDVYRDLYPLSATEKGRRLIREKGFG